MQLFNTRRNKNICSNRVGLAALVITVGCSIAPALAAPSAPSAPNMLDASDSGSSSSDDITSNTKPAFSGTGKPLSFIELFAGSLPAGVAITGPNGQWTINSSLTLSEGTWIMTARQTTNGTVSAVSSPLTIFVDTTAPTVTVPDMTPSSDSGMANNDNITNLTKPTFQGSATAGTTVNIFNTTLSSSNPIGSAKVSAQGKWSASASFPSGTHSYHAAAQSVDLAGNKSSLMGWLPLTIDTDVPATATQAPDLIAADDSGVSPTDNLTKVTTPTFTAKAEPNTIIKIFGFASEVAQYGSQMADANGNATIKTTNAIPEGYFNVYSKVTDVAGNTTDDISPSFVIQIDTTAPAQAGKAGLSQISNSGSPYDNVTNVKTPFVNGLFSYEEADLTIDFFAGVFHYSAHTDVAFKDYKWSVLAPSLPDGKYAVTVSNIDEAGNVSVNEPGFVVVDSFLPKVAITSPVNAAPLKTLTSVSGTASDFTSGIDRAELSLKRNSDNLYWNGNVFNAAKSALKTTVSGDAWTRDFDLPPAAQMLPGTYTLTAQAFDKAGNASSVSSVTFGNVAPENVGVTPGNGWSQFGVARNLTATYIDTNGVSDITDARLLIAPTLTGTGTLTGRYMGGKLYLVSDNGQVAMGGFAPGSSNFISNSQGTLDCSKTTVSINGNALIINWNFIPKASFVGFKKLYALVNDKQGAQDGWDFEGTWEILAPATVVKPSGNTS